MAVKVMIADDHSMIREGLKQLLELEGDFEVIAEACDGVDCLEKLKTVVPDILLLDINMPNMNGLEVLQKMKDMKMKVLCQKPQLSPASAAAPKAVVSTISGLSTGMRSRSACICSSTSDTLAPPSARSRAMSQPASCRMASIRSVT